jgi:hypothetical protein
MTRLVRRFATPASSILLGLLAGCASNPVGSTPSSGATSGNTSTSGSGVTSGTGTGGTKSGGSGTSGSATSGAADGGIDAAAFCRVPSMDAGGLPFIVDTVYVPSGWMGDAPAYMAVAANLMQGSAFVPATTARMTLAPSMYGTIGDACSTDKDSYGVTVGRSSPNAKGACWKVVFVPFPKTVQPGSAAGTTKIGGGPGLGWAGAFWQYPKNNWGTLAGGYPLPTGANTVSFWARGKDGGEKVRFFTGEGAGIPCSDFVAADSYNAVFPLTPAWTHYTIDITNLYYGTANVTPGQGLGGIYGGVLGAFGFGVGDQTLPSLDGGSAPPNAADLDAAPVADPAVPGQTFPPFFDSTVTFYIDDIEWQLTTPAVGTDGGTDGGM